MAVVQGQTLGRPLAGTEIVAQRASRKRRSPIVEMIRRQPIGLLSLVLLLTIILAGVFAELISARDPAAQLLRDSLKPPGTLDREGATYWLGTDSLGRDVFTRILHGARISLAVGGASVIIGTIGGLLIGLVSGYRGGRIDMLIQRVMDSVQAIPTLVLATLLVASLGPAGRNLIVTAIAIGITQIPRANRVIRSNVLSVSREVFVESAKAVGAPEARIIFRHILPNVVATTLIIFSTSIGAAIVTEATLSFLGLAAPPPWVTWGGMLTIQGRQFMVTAPWLLVAPAVALSITVLAFNFLGDAVRDEMDPRLRGR
jgi:ABC-type dipeptide/oligopeptide/nickel transport system permease subunit